MKNQALVSLKDKSKKLKCRLLQFLFGLNVFISILLQHVSHITTCKFLGLERKHIAYLVLLQFLFGALRVYPVTVCKMCDAERSLSYH